jgi:chemotaxis signal transduction protein
VKALNIPKAADTLRLIRCDLADETYGLDMTWVHSIQRIDLLRRNSQDESHPVEAYIAAEELHHLVGWISMDEGEVPVFSLAHRIRRASKFSQLEVDGGRGELQRIVVLNHPKFQAQEIVGELWGLLVDRVSQVIQVPAVRVTPLPTAVVNPAEEYFSGVVRMGEQFVLLLSPEWLHPDRRYRSKSFNKQGKGSAERQAKEQCDNKPMQVAASAPKPLRTERRERKHGFGQIVIFSIRGAIRTERKLTFGLSISQIPEILEPLPTIPIPAAPAFVLGLINWRDRPVPLIDMADRLGLKSSSALPVDEPARLVIARDKVNGASTIQSSVEDGDGTSSGNGTGGGALVGFLIQPSVQVLSLPIEHRAGGRVPHLDQELIRGIVELENATLVIPDIGRILKGE